MMSLAFAKKFFNKNSSLLLDNSTRNGILEDVESGEQNDLYYEETRFDAWTTTRYLQDITTGYGVVLAETTETNANLAEKLVTGYVYGLERITGLTTGTIDGAADTRTLRSEYVYDARGSVAQSVEKSNNVEILTQSNSEISSLIDIHSFSYTPFGELSGAKSSGYRFNGEEYDAATGMLNLRVRQYEPAMMRFSQMDLVRGEVAKPITLNRYVYCYDEPVGFVDPSGMRPPESGTYVGDDKYYDENGNLKGSNSGTATPTPAPTPAPSVTPYPAPGPTPSGYSSYDYTSPTTPTQQTGSALTDWMRNAIDAARNALNSLWQSAKVALDGLAKYVCGSPGTGSLIDDVVDMLDTVGVVASAVVNGAKNLVGSWLSFTWNLQMYPWKRLGNWVVTRITDFFSPVTNAVNWISDIFAPQPVFVGSSVGGGGEFGESFGREFGGSSVGGGGTFGRGSGRMFGDSSNVLNASSAAGSAGASKIPNVNINSLPQNVQDAYKGYESVNWRGNYPGQAKGTRAGRVWENKDGVLPTTNMNGQTITYKEYDINAKTPDVGRDMERFVSGNDGSVYYTNDHYLTFVKVK